MNLLAVLGWLGSFGEVVDISLYRSHQGFLRIEINGPGDVGFSGFSFPAPLYVGLDGTLKLDAERAELARAIAIEHA